MGDSRCFDLLTATARELEVIRGRLDHPSKDAPLLQGSCSLQEHVACQPISQLALRCS